MDDKHLWNLGTVRLTCLLADLPAGTMLEFAPLLARYRTAKEAFASVVADVDAAVVCRECAGQCCQNGKYRINVLDALARIVAEIPTSADFSQKPLCPYGSHAGCTMEPAWRPADCIMFICDDIDQRLPPEASAILAAEEQVLRECIRISSCLTGEPLGTPLLIWAANSVTNSKSKV